MSKFYSWIGVGIVYALFHRAFLEWIAIGVLLVILDFVCDYLDERRKGK